MAAQLICIAPLENPRVDGSYVYFDAPMFSINDKGRAIIAGLRYFNSLGIQFRTDGPNLCMIIATIVKYETKAYKGLHPGASVRVCDEADYDLIGDIVHLVPAPGIPLPSASFPPYIICTGTVTSHDSLLATFTMAPNPWTSLLHNEGSFPFKGIFPTNGRWKNGRKPLPLTGNFVTIGGRLQQAVDRPVEGGPAGSYVVEIDSVTFSPRSSNNNASDMTTDPATPPQSSLKRRKIAYTYDSTIPSFTSLPAAPLQASPSPSSLTSLSNNSPATGNSPLTPSHSLQHVTPESPETPCPSRPSFKRTQSQAGPSSLPSQGKHSMTTRRGAVQDKQSAGKDLKEAGDEDL